MLYSTLYLFFSVYCAKQFQNSFRQSDPSYFFVSLRHKKPGNRTTIELCRHCHMQNVFGSQTKSRPQRSRLSGTSRHLSKSTGVSQTVSAKIRILLPKIRQEFQTCNSSTRKLLQFPPLHTRTAACRQEADKQMRAL